MSRSLNKLTLIGNVGTDPEMRTMADGTKLAKLSLATNHRWKDRHGDAQERTDWHRLTCWDKLAEIVEDYVSAGDQLYVEGRVEYGSYDRDDGVSIPTAEVRVRELIMLGGRRQQRPDVEKEVLEL